MRKLFVWATMAALLVAGSALAAGPVTSLNAGRMFIQPNATFAPAASFAFTATGPNVSSGPTTTNNDDSCDISTMPAATLLLPYFEVDFRSPSSSAINTNFTITNVSPFATIAHVTLWTDRSFPVLDFNIFLTGYDVQGINLYDIIARGQIPPTGAGTASPVANAFLPNSPVGPRSNLNNANPNLVGVFTTCSALAGPIPGAPAAGSTTATGLLLDIQNALSRGTYSLCGAGTPLVGNDHGAAGLASGYVTVDVSSACSTTLPTTAAYYSGEILFDNVLIGDYQRINPVASGSVSLAGDAGGNPMVHIRAIPEGGPVGGAGAVSNLPFTFYDRYTPVANRKQDRRQPLPGVFAARYISGGTGTMDTRVNIWREGVRSGTQTEACLVAENAVIPSTEVVRFDERENPSAFTPTDCPVSPCTPSVAPPFSFPEASSNPMTLFPALVTTDVGGWLYLNLNNRGNLATSGPARTFVAPVAPAVFGTAGGTHAGASQNWVTVTQSAATSGLGRFSVEFDAAALGNGCSGNPGVSVATRGGQPPIGPVGGSVGVGAQTATNATP